MARLSSAAILALFLPCRNLHSQEQTARPKSPKSDKGQLTSKLPIRDVAVFADSALQAFTASLMRSGVSGSRFNLTPAASKSAFAIRAPMQVIGGSPPP